MRYEQEARTMKGMEEKIQDLKAMLEAIESDFAKCAKGGIAPCFFCDNDDNCIGTPETCKFKWIRHT